MSLLFKMLPDEVFFSSKKVRKWSANEQNPPKDMIDMIYVTKMTFEKD